MKFLLVLLLIGLTSQVTAQDKPHVESQTLAEESGAKTETIDEVFTWPALEGRFTQTLIDNTQDQRVESQGTFRILRPGYAEWLVDQPDQEAFYLSPEGLWHFDPWLEVASFHAAEELDAASAIALLSGDTAALRDEYEITYVDGKFKLLSLDTEAQVEWIELSVDQDTIPSLMFVQTRLARSLEIQFLEARPTDINPSDLAFEPPAGVEIQ